MCVHVGSECQYGPTAHRTPASSLDTGEAAAGDGMGGSGQEFTPGRAFSTPRSCLGFIPGG